MMNNEKVKLFIDLDDTVFESSKTVIKMLNNKYGLNKTYEDLRDWEYRSIYKYMTKDLVNEIYDSKELFDNITIDNDFNNFYQNNCDKFDIYFVSKGSSRNIELKREFVKNNFPKATLIPCMIFEVEDFDKSHIDMDNSIQIDDRFDCLEKTNAKCKILITHSRNFRWNYVKKPVENLYIVNEWEDAIKIINFFNNNKTFLENGV